MYKISNFYCVFALLSCVIFAQACAPLVMRHAHVIPIYEGQVLLSAKPEFIGSGPRYNIDDPRFDRPKMWGCVTIGDGSTIVTWISKCDAQEKLVFVDSGFHPYPVPGEAITELKQPSSRWNDRMFISEDKPFPMIFDNHQNTAWAPYTMKLAPLKKMRPRANQ